MESVLIKGKIRTVAMNENEPMVHTEAVKAEPGRENVIPKKLEVNKKKPESMQLVHNIDGIEVNSAAQESLEEKLKPVISTVTRTPTQSTGGDLEVVILEK